MRTTTTRLESGNSLTANGDLSGDLLFTNRPTIHDLVEVVLNRMESQVNHFSEDREFGEAAAVARTAARLAEWSPTFP